jgi:hypothetical protein
LQALALSHYLHLLIGNLLILFLEFLQFILIVLFLLLLEQFRVGLLPLDDCLLGLFEFPQTVLHVLLLLEQFVLHLVVVAEEEHLIVYEGLEGMGLEAHVHQEDQVIQQLGVLFGGREVPLGQLGVQDGLEVVQLLQDLRVYVVSLQRDVEEQELIPGSVEKFV